MVLSMGALLKWTVQEKMQKKGKILLKKKLRKGEKLTGEGSSMHL